MGHLSKTYLSNQTKTKFIPEYKKQSKLSTYKFQREKIEPGLEKFELRTKYPRNRVYGLKLHRSVLKTEYKLDSAKTSFWELKLQVKSQKAMKQSLQLMDLSSNPMEILLD